MGTQHHGRDQVLKGWDLNQWQPEEGDNNGTLGRKDRKGNRAAPKAQASEEQEWEGNQIRTPQWQEVTPYSTCALVHP